MPVALPTSRSRLATEALHAKSSYRLYVLQYSVQTERLREETLQGIAGQGLRAGLVPSPTGGESSEEGQAGKGRGEDQKGNGIMNKRTKKKGLT